MKRLRLERWSGQALQSSSYRRPCCVLDRPKFLVSSLQNPSTSSSPRITRRTLFGAAQAAPNIVYEEENPEPSTPSSAPSPPISAASKSAKLAALHARLSLPKRLPLETLARTLVDASADPDTQFNNASLSATGSALLSYHVTEYLLCKYPRLPLSVFYGSLSAYIGPATLNIIAKEWGLESAAYPGPEVDPGLLQFQRLDPGTQLPKSPENSMYTDLPSATRRDVRGYRRGMASRVVYDDDFGDIITPGARREDPKPSQDAHAHFVKALIGALYLHAGRKTARDFIYDHILSRHLQIANLFQFPRATRDLARLCAREDFPEPVARMLSETGRKSIAPVFVVGIFSGEEKLGEGAAASLGEARTRAAVNALKSWYLYSPTPQTGRGVNVPSDTEKRLRQKSDETLGEKGWESVYIDLGEII